MKVIAVCGSPRTQGSSTLAALKPALQEIEQAGLTIELIKLADYSFGGCISCGACRKKVDCSQDDDFRRKILPRLTDPQIKGFLFASPVYFGGITSQLKAFFDRCIVFRRNGFAFASCVAGGLTIGGSRNGGQELAVMDIIKNCMIQGMLIVSDSPPTSHFGGILCNGLPEDTIGLQTALNLGKRLAEVVKKLNRED